MRRGIPVVLSMIVVFFLNLNLVSQPQSSVAKISPASGKKLCAALTPADFARAGVPVKSLHEANIDGTANAYCVYESKVGRVEFDIFYPAGETVQAAIGTEETVMREVGGKFEEVKLADADSTTINLAVPGRRPSASIVVRKKTAVFTIDVPGGSSAREQLEKLSRTVLARLEK